MKNFRNLDSTIHSQAPLDASIINLSASTLAQLVISKLPQYTIFLHFIQFNIFTFCPPECSGPIPKCLIFPTLVSPWSPPYLFFPSAYDIMDTLQMSNHYIIYERSHISPE